MASFEERSIIGQYVNVGRERYNDRDTAKLLYIIENRDRYNGHTEVYPGYPHSGRDSHMERYEIQERKTYTFISDERGIRIICRHERYLDGVKDDDYEEIFDSGRGLINNFNWILRKSYW